MRIESVTSVAFGPFRNCALELSPGFTVVYGPNEAGKSSWHAAIYAALCGMRRARGAAKKSDREFAELRRPWTGDEWEVRAIVRLDGGRRVELRQNFSDLARCSAIDADLGRDAASEILNEGTPDAARWLGLDRQSFFSVACVRQAEIQSVVQDADSLQDELQRAAASVSRDSTAAQAIARLEEFRRERVGLDRANSARPLRRATLRVQEGEARLERARARHVEWLSAEEHAREKKRRADIAGRDLRLLRARRADAEAAAAARKLDDARRLSASYPGGRPAWSDDQSLANDVASALSVWENLTDPPPLTGLDSAAIQAAIDALPATPPGDLEPRQEIVDAKAAFDRAAQALALHAAHEPPELPPADARGWSAAELRDAATLLDTPIPAADPASEAECLSLRGRLGRVRWWSAHPAMAILAAALLLAGAAVGAFADPLPGAVLVLAGLGAIVWGYRAGAAARSVLRDALVTAEARLLAARNSEAAARERVAEAGKRAAAAGLPVDSDELRRLADRLVSEQPERRVREQWLSRREELRQARDRAAGVLAKALQVAGTADLSAAYQDYASACRTRTSRATLAEQLRLRLTAEEAAGRAQSRRVDAERSILSAAKRCGFSASDAASAVDLLKRWQEQRGERLREFDRAAREYAGLEAMLEGGTLADLEARTTTLRGIAAQLATGLGPLPEGGVEDEELSRAEQFAQDAERAAIQAATAAHERARDLPCLVEAEETVASAQREVERLTALDRTLGLALQFLAAAEERVHRDIAPQLAGGLQRWLPAVTGGRYSDARVDPASLSVTVLARDGQWRDARHLSHGSAEQVYLLLRVALAERLATTGESCPLILDDVLVQSDSVRKRALLDAIVSISRERQVVLFTQEEEVRAWARANLAPPDRVVELSGPEPQRESGSRHAVA